MLYKLLVEWYGGGGERLPSHTKRAVQDPYSKVFQLKYGNLKILILGNIYAPRGESLL